MSFAAVFQNIVLLAAALGILYYTHTGWGFLLLIFWLSPKSEDAKSDSKEEQL